MERGYWALWCEHDKTRVVVRSSDDTHDLVVHWMARIAGQTWDHIDCVGSWLVVRDSWYLGEGEVGKLSREHFGRHKSSYECVGAWLPRVVKVSPLWRRRRGKWRSNYKTGPM